MKLRLTDIKGLVAVFRHVKKVFYTILFRVTNTKIMPAYSCFIVILLSLCGIIWDSQTKCYLEILFQTLNSVSLTSFPVKTENHWLCKCFEGEYL